MSTSAPPSTVRAGAIELIGAMTLSGTIGFFVLKSGASPGTVVFFRCVFGAAALAIYCWMRGYFSTSGLTRAKARLAAVGGIFIVFNWLLLFASYGKTSISIATVVYHTQPFLVMILGALVLKEKVTLNKWAWLLLAFVGVVLVSNITLGSDPGQGYLLGIAYALGAAVLYAVATIIAKRLTGVKPHIIALLQCLVGIPLLAPFAGLQGVGELGGSWGWLISLGVIHTCVMYILMYSSYQKLPTPMIAVLSFVYPAVALVVDLTAFGTRINDLQMLGMLLIVGASLAMSFNVGGRAPRETRPAPAPTTRRVPQEVGR